MTEAYTWDLDAKLYTIDGEQVGRPPVSSFVQPEGVDTPPTAILMRIVPPETWPTEMILAMPGSDGKPDAVRRIVIRLQEK